MHLTVAINPLQFSRVKGAYNSDEDPGWMVSSFTGTHNSVYSMTDSSPHTAATETLEAFSHFTFEKMEGQLLLEGFECVSKRSSLSFFDNGILIAQFIDVSTDDHDATSGIIIIYFKTHT